MKIYIDKFKIYKMIIYILKLTDNKYYIGKTFNLKRRIYEHKIGIGSKWTKKYPMIGIIKTIKTNDLFSEDKYVKYYMNRYGIDNVRGGSYNQLTLLEDQKKFLKREFNTINNQCYRCGRNNHFIKNCYAKTDINGKVLNTTNNNKFVIQKNNNILSNIYNDIITDIKSIYRYFKY